MTIAVLVLGTIAALAFLTVIVCMLLDTVWNLDAAVDVAGVAFTVFIGCGVVATILGLVTAWRVAL